jgi:hypothetical protein
MTRLLGMTNDELVSACEHARQLHSRLVKLTDGCPPSSLAALAVERARSACDVLAAAVAESQRSCDHPLESRRTMIAPPSFPRYHGRQWCRACHKILPRDLQEKQT